MAPFLPKKRFLSINTAILIKGCQQNDVLCQEQLYKLFYPDMIKVCYRYTNDLENAGTVYNNAMLKVFKGIDSYKEEGKLGGWVKAIVINCCIDFCKKKVIFHSSMDIIAENEVITLPNVFERLSGKDIQQMIAELPKATAAIFNLYVYDGFTHTQIGELLNISDGTSKWHLSEAKKILRSKLEQLSKTELKANAAG
jgi:RNA polymerase sigma-70 factor, ECF subfamily